MERERYKVMIQCKKCGERFILRGTMTEEGRIETGFRQCVCNNRESFNIETEEM